MTMQRSDEKTMSFENRVFSSEKNVHDTRDPTRWRECVWVSNAWRLDGEILNALAFG
jgi:hypothetical protein